MRRGVLRLPAQAEFTVGNAARPGPKRFWHRRIQGPHSGQHDRPGDCLGCRTGWVCHSLVAEEDPMKKGTLCLVVLVGLAAGVAQAAETKMAAPAAAGEGHAM